MLQRAASNAYSWWWASHIRTKQSKWMEQNLQDMEEKVAITLKLIEEDGDSFAKRAEMYYKRRPELINFVEESFRAYRALADRYDHLSSELQNANNTIASVFPDQVQFSMDDDDDDNSPRMQKRPPEIGKSNIPNVPNMPTKEFKRTLTSCKKKLLPSKSMKKSLAAKSGLSKPEGLNKIDKLQKQILALQTEKEFVKSSYESRLAKYWDIENQIVEAQEQVCSLEDEFGEGMIIEDDDARVLMAAAAINSCQETLAELEEKQEMSAEQAKAEDKKIKLARNRLVSFKDESVDNEVSHKNSDAKFDSDKAVEDIGRLDQDVESEKQKREDSKALGQKKDEHFEVASNASLSVTEMAEKIDELVNKVISLETAVSSQESLLQRLQTETDELQAQIQTLEDDKATLIKAKDELSIKLIETEKKLSGLQNLNSNVEDQNNNLQTTNDRCNLEHSSKTEETSSVQTKLQKQSEEQEGAMNPSDGLKKQRSVKLSEDLVTNSLERENIQGGELKLTEASEKLQSVKLSEDLVTTPLERENIQGGELKLTEGSEKLQSVKLSENLVTTSLERENIQGGELKLTEGSEKLHSEKLDEDVKVSGATQLEEKSMVKVGSTKDFKEQEEILNKGDNSKNARDVQKEEVKGIKEHDISATTRNQGEVSQSQENGEPGDLLEKSQDQKNQDKVDKQVSSLPQVVATKQDDEPDWKQLFLNGMENKEKVLLTEYTTILRNFKELKKKLNEGDTKNEDCKLQMTMQLKELNSVNAKKDEEIRSLRQKLSFLQQGFDQSNNLDYQATVSEIPAEGEEDNGVIQEDEDQTISPVEEKFRMELDELLEENLDFWLRFSTAFHQIQKFETEVKDLQAEVSKLEEKQNKGEGSSSHKYSLKSDVRPIYKHLKEIQTELTVWMEKSALLKEELKSRFSSLCDIQEDITKALKVSAEDYDFKFTSYQAAKFQGEVLNMKQENNKVADELQAGLDHVTNLQFEVEKTLGVLSEEFGISASKSSPNMEYQRSGSKSRVPLRSFIFGVKPKKQKTSFLACVHPALHRKYNHRPLNG